MERDEGKGEPVDYDKVLDHIGQFGHFQKRIFLWLSFVSAAAGLAMVAFAFTGTGDDITEDNDVTEKIADDVTKTKVFILESL